jgi:hypothetical protein
MGEEAFNTLYLKQILLSASSGKSLLLQWTSFFLTMRFGKKKSVVWHDAELLGLRERTSLSGRLLLFHRFQK